ncbi:MAG: PilT/PilU family type 4a pilus ATPase [Rickettsiales bacterium]|nr:PilT/PilU family type 4a pilus ATPase [Rickettsiales bacterium]
MPILDPMLEQVVYYEASDLYITQNCPPCLRKTDFIQPLRPENMAREEIESILKELLDEELMDEYESTLELNTSIKWRDEARFRINVYQQQQCPALVLRRIATQVPTIEELGLPKIYSDLIMIRRGLILVVGTTGSGKSTSLAAMIDHRNANGGGHIMTIEDPIEFIHEHNGCIVSQRDVGIDTFSFGIALKNVLRQRPDVVLIGEIRDRETMEHALNFAETGHLCVATLHANNANQTIERILSFFPEEKQAQVRLNLSLNLRGIVAQRLVINQEGTRTLACEIMLNNGLIRSLIEEGKINEIKPLMERSNEEGMQTFDQCLFDLFEQGIISDQVAIAEADNVANLKLRMTQKSTSMKVKAGALKPDAKPAPEPEAEAQDKPLPDNEQF